MLEGIVQRFLYHPTEIPGSAPAPSWAPGAEELWIDSSDGERIHGLRFEAPEGRPTVLFFHGNAQSVYEWCLVSEDLAPLECGLCLIDYPGYGKSTGRPTEAGLYAAGRAALEWLTSDLGIDPGQLVVFGKSLGGGVATEIVRRREDLLGLVLESTFRSIPSVASRLLPMIPTDSVLKSERYESLARMEEIRCPLLVIHGTDDDLIPVDEGRALYEAAGERKELYLVDGAGHNDVSMVAGAAYGDRLRRWLDEIS